MALWQFDVFLIPHAAVLAQVERPFEPEPITWLPDEREREQAWWAEHQPVPGYQADFDALLPRTRSWAADLARWGSEDGHRIDVWTDAAGRVESMLARIDLRAEDPAFVGRLADIVQDLGCDYVTRDGLLALGVPGNLAILLRQSRALRFVTEPAAFLARIRAGGIEDA